MSENHWKSFESLPEDGILIRVKEPPDKATSRMIRHGETLKYQIHPDDPWQDVGVFTEYVFSHCVWCYDSQYTPELTPEDLKDTRKSLKHGNEPDSPHTTHTCPKCGHTFLD